MSEINNAPQVEAEPTPVMFPESHVKELREEAASYRVRARDVQAQLDAKVAELSAIQEAKQALESKVAELEVSSKSTEVTLIKVKALAELGLPLELLNRVQGETEEEVQADIAALATIIQPVKSTLKPPTGESKTSSGEALYKKLRG